MKSIKEIVDKFKVFIFDCDGILWSGTTKIPNAIETLPLLEKLGKKVFFLTNNSSKSRKQYTQKFNKFGYNPKIE